MERLSKVGRDQVLSWLRIFSYYVLGITGGYGGDRRVEYIIPPEARKQGYHHQFVIKSSCNGMFSVPWNGDTIAPPDVNPVL
jgi:hypothetical protein